MNFIYEAVMPFGKHRDIPISKVPSRYLRWLLRETDIANPLRAEVEIELKLRKLQQPIQPEELEGMTPAKCDQILQNLGRLKSVCDGAQRRDSAGYGKAHVQFGHSLAELPALSARQAAYGQRLVRRHRRQLAAMNSVRDSGKVQALAFR